MKIEMEVDVETVKRLDELQSKAQSGSLTKDKLAELESFLKPIEEKIKEELNFKHDFRKALWKEVIGITGIMVLGWGGTIALDYIGFAQLSFGWLAVVCFSFLIYSYFYRKRELKKEFEEIMSLAKIPEGRRGENQNH